MDTDKKNVERPCETDTPLKSGGWRFGREGLWAQKVSWEDMSWFYDALFRLSLFISIP